MQDNWAKWLFSVEFITNNHISKTIEVSPFFANSGQHPRISFEFIGYYENPTGLEERLTRVIADAFAVKMINIDKYCHDQMTFAQVTQAEFANRHRQLGFNYRVGDEVWLDIRNLWIQESRSPKLANKFEGSFPILEIISSHAYRLKLSPN